MMLLAFFFMIIIYKSGLLITLHYGAKKLPGSEAVCINGPSSMLDITHHLIRLLSVSLIGVNGIVLARKLFTANMSGRLERSPPTSCQYNIQEDTFVRLRGSN